MYGRRIQSVITKAGQPANNTSGTPSTVQYLYEGAQALGELRDGILSHRLLTGLSLDETIARIAINTNGQKDSTNSRIYLTDALNSVIAQLSDDNTNPGQLQNSYAYSPYGESSTIGPDATNNPNQYTSRENDGTGLYFYRARYLDPQLKIWISEDPIGLRAGLNVRAYVGGDPVGKIDPKGLFSIIVGGGGSFVVGAGGEGSVGAYFNPGFFGDCSAAGVFASGGVGGGYNVGVNSYVGTVFGPASNVNSPFVNLNISAGLGSLTIMFDPTTGDWAGVSIGPGVELGVSVTYTDTGKTGGKGGAKECMCKR